MKERGGEGEREGRTSNTTQQICITGQNPSSIPTHVTIQACATKQTWESIQCTKCVFYDGLLHDNQCSRFNNNPTLRFLGGTNTLEVGPKSGPTRKCRFALDLSGGPLEPE